MVRRIEGPHTDKDAKRLQELTDSGQLGELYNQQPEKNKEDLDIFDAMDMAARTLEITKELRGEAVDPGDIRKKVVQEVDQSLEKRAASKRGKPASQ